MAFDRTNPAHLAALKAEVQTDPLGFGYAEVVDVTPDLLALLNDPAAHPVGATVQRPIDEITVPEVSAVIDQTEYAALPAYDRNWALALIMQPAETALLPYKNKFLQLFPVQGSVTGAAAAALLDVAASRAEELFGYGTRILRDDWIAARDSGRR